MGKKEINVLLVEDNGVDAERIERALAKATGAHFHIKRAKQLSEAIDLAESFDFEIVLCDLNLPDAYGFEIFESIHTKFPHVACVLVTDTVAETEIAVRALEAGAQDCLAKDKVQDEDLANRILYAVERNCHHIGLENLKRRLEISRNSLQNVVMASADGIVVVNNAGNIVFANPAAERLFGKGQDKLVGMPFGFPMVLRKPMEIEVRLANGRMRTAEMRVVKTTWQEEEQVYLTSLRDVTARKKAEEKIKKTATDLTRSNKELDAFAYTISHDLRVPLRSIISFSQLVRQNNIDKLDNDSIEDLDLVIESGRKMNNMMEAVLEYSRIGRTEMEKTAVDLGSVVADVLKIMYGDISQTGAKVKVEGEFPTINCNRERVEQVFLNLIGNALKYVQNDSAPQISVGCTKKNGVHCCYVRDNGIGIEKNQFSKIFDVFKRLHTESSRYSGMGVGLSNVKKIIDLHGGSIWVESEIGKGSTFYFTLQAH